MASPCSFVIPSACALTGITRRQRNRDARTHRSRLPSIRMSTLPFGDPDFLRTTPYIDRVTFAKNTLSGWIAGFMDIRIVITERLVKQVFRADGDYPVPLRQTITDGGIAQPELVLPGNGGQGGISSLFRIIPLLVDSTSP